MPRTFAGSFAGPTTMKSLYITSRRSTPNPAATNLSSSGRLWTSTTSTSPFSPSFMAFPVPTEITWTLRPLAASNFGTITLSRPELSVLVVGGEAQRAGVGRERGADATDAACANAMDAMTLPLRVLYCGSFQVTFPGRRACSRPSRPRAQRKRRERANAHNACIGASNQRARDTARSRRSVTSGNEVEAGEARLRPRGEPGIRIARLDRRGEVASGHGLFAMEAHRRAPHAVALEQTARRARARPRMAGAA
jgi:hypothetical protein